MMRTVSDYNSGGNINAIRAFRAEFNKRSAVCYSCYNAQRGPGLQVMKQNQVSFSLPVEHLLWTESQWVTTQVFLIQLMEHAREPLFIAVGNTLGKDYSITISAYSFRRESAPKEMAPFRKMPLLLGTKRTSGLSSLLHLFHVSLLNNYSMTGTVLL